MKPKRDETLNQQELSEQQQETFRLYIVDYVRINQAESILSTEYQDCLGCRLKFLFFIPENQVNHSITVCRNILHFKSNLGLNQFYQILFFY